MAPRFAVPGAPAAAAFRGRPGGRAWVDLRSCLELAKELGCYSVTVGAVCITLRLPQDAAAAGRKPGRVAGRPDPAQQRPKRVPSDRSPVDPDRRQRAPADVGGGRATLSARSDKQTAAQPRARASVARGTSGRGRHALLHAVCVHRGRARPLAPPCGGCSALLCVAALGCCAGERRNCGGALACQPKPPHGHGPGARGAGGRARCAGGCCRPS